MSSARVMADDERYFRAIPWCQELLQDPAFETRYPGFRQPKESTEDQFFSVTLNTKETVERCIAQVQKPVSGGKPRIEEARCFLTIATGLNGFAGVCHGGMVATMLDEAIGLLLVANQKLIGDMQPLMTAYLNITYRKPVATRQAVLVKAYLGEVKGRKWKCHTEILNGKGEVLATGEGLFVRTKAQL